MIKIKNILLFLLLVSLSSFVKADKTKLQIELKNCKKEFIIIKNNNPFYKEYFDNKRINIKQTDGIINLNLDIKEPIILSVGNLFEVFILPGDDLKVKAFVKNLDSKMVINFEGKSAKDNYIFKNIKDKIYDYFPGPIGFIHNKDITYSLYLKKFRKAQKDMKSMLIKESDINGVLFSYIDLFINLFMPAEFNMLPMHNEIKDFSPIKYFPIKDLNINMAGAFYVNFGFIISNIISLEADRKYKDYKSCSKRQKFIYEYQGIKNCIENEDVKCLLINMHLEYGIRVLFSDCLKELDLIIEEYKEMFPKNKFVNKTCKLYNLQLKIMPNKVLPFIQLKTINGKDFNLKSLKGNVLYVDFWASWCSACRYQMKKGASLLHENIKGNNIKCVYISVDENKKNWVNAIKQDKIEGIHLLADIDDVYEIFGINGYPHYFIIDKNGKISNNNAPRPTNPETISLLKEISNK